MTESDPFPLRFRNIAGRNYYAPSALSRLVLEGEPFGKWKQYPFYYFAKTKFYAFIPGETLFYSTIEAEAQEACISGYEGFRPTQAYIEQWVLEVGTGYAKASLELEKLACLREAVGHDKIAASLRSLVSAASLFSQEDALKTWVDKALKLTKEERFLRERGIDRQLEFLGNSLYAFGANPPPLSNLDSKRRQLGVQ